MSIITLLSGGLDSSLMSILIKERQIKQFPLFINYGQLNFNQEYSSAVSHCEEFDLGKLEMLDIKNYGMLIESGITNPKLDVITDAFLPGRNFLFILIATSYAYKMNANKISIGFLNEETSLFPDQSDDFLISVENTISKAYARKIEIITPLRNFYKKDVVSLAKKKGLTKYYSCHKGNEKPCGNCISCNEYK